MELKFKKKMIVKYLETVTKIIQSNSPLPALQGLLIVATESNIKLLASNGNLSIKEIIEESKEVKIIEAGKVLVPGKLLFEVIKKQDDEITISTDKNSMIIDSNNASTTIQLLNADDYPRIAFEDIGKELIIDSDNLKEIIRNVSFAAADNDKRIILNGVNLLSKDGYITASATNSFRLAQEKLEVDSNSEFDITILSKNLKDFIPKDAKGSLTINVNNGGIITKYKNTTISSKLIDGMYPNVSKLIPSNFKNILKIDKSTLNNLIDKVTVVSEEGNKIVRLTIKDNKLTLESKRNEIGDSKIECSDIKWTGDEKFVIVFNSGFLRDALAKFDGEVGIGFNGSHAPFVVKSKSNDNLIQLILPHVSY